MGILGLNKYRWKADTVLRILMLDRGQRTRGVVYNKCLSSQIPRFARNDHHFKVMSKQGSPLSLQTMSEPSTMLRQAQYDIAQSDKK